MSQMILASASPRRKELLEQIRGRVCNLSGKGRGSNHRDGSVGGRYGIVPAKSRGSSLRSTHL